MAASFAFQTLLDQGPNNFAINLQIGNPLLFKCNLKFFPTFSSTL